MSFFKKNLKIKALVALGCLAVAGVAAAYIPATGTKWQERTWYQNGQPVGGVLYDCDGSVQSWGVNQGTMKITQGPCLQQQQ